jgi:transposase
MARAYELKLDFEELWELPAGHADAYLEDWCDRAYRTKLEPLLDFVDTLDAHWEDVLRWFKTRITNGVPEAIKAWFRRRSGAPVATGPTSTTSP